MAKTLLVSVEKVKNLSTLESNADDKALSRVILNTQETHLRGVLGSKLYSDVIEEVNASVANSAALASPTKELLDDYIVPYMVYATLSDFVVLNSFKFSNKGLMKLNDNSGQAATAQEIENVKNYYDNYTSTYKSALIQYLKEKGLTTGRTDTNTSSGSIGWFLY